MTRACVMLSLKFLVKYFFFHKSNTRRIDVLRSMQMKLFPGRVLKNAVKRPDRVNTYISKGQFWYDFAWTILSGDNLRCLKDKTFAITCFTKNVSDMFPRES